MAGQRPRSSPARRPQPGGHRAPRGRDRRRQPLRGRGRGPDETAASAAHALSTAAAELAGLGIRIERVLTDNGPAYVSHAYRAAIEDVRARHKRTRAYRPQTNGKAERFIGTLVREWAYGAVYRTNDERSSALGTFVDFYNRRRPHTALAGRAPIDVVNNVSGEHN